MSETTDVMHWILALPIPDICARMSRIGRAKIQCMTSVDVSVEKTDFFAQIRSLLIAMVLNSSNVDPAI
jgi:hypothetical protein